MTYTGTKAFSSWGAKMFVGDVEVAEIRKITVGFRTNIEMNFIPSDRGQAKLLDAVITGNRVGVLVKLSAKEFIFQNALLEGGVSVIPNDVVLLNVSFQTDGTLADPADDGPEVNLIRRETLQGDRVIEPAGGGFTLVTEATDAA